METKTNMRRLRLFLQVTQVQLHVRRTRVVLPVRFYFPDHEKCVPSLVEIAPDVQQLYLNTHAFIYTSTSIFLSFIFLYSLYFHFLSFTGLYEYLADPYMASDF